MATFPRPNLHIVGVQKAGTTALSHFLSQHPDICLVEGKEAHVFDDPLFYTAKNKTQFALQKYQSKLKHYTNQQYICDATPITLFHPSFMQSCVEFNPKARFIVALRDPVERAMSHYHMSRARQLETRGPALAFLLEPWRMRGWQTRLPESPFEHPYRDFSYLQRGCYKKQLDVLFKLVEERQVLIVNQRQLKEHHQQTMQNIFEFLALPAIDVPAKQVFANVKTPKHRCARLIASCYFWLFCR